MNASMTLIKVKTTKWIVTLSAKIDNLSVWKFVDLGAKKARGF